MSLKGVFPIEKWDFKSNSVITNLPPDELATLTANMSTQLYNKGEIIFNLSFSILSFASIIIPIAAKLPLDVQNPELFPGLTVPMHFFPALGWYTLKPIFIKEQATLPAR